MDEILMTVMPPGVSLENENEPSALYRAIHRANDQISQIKKLKKNMVSKNETSKKRKRSAKSDHEGINQCWTEI